MMVGGLTKKRLIEPGLDEIRFGFEPAAGRRVIRLKLIRPGSGSTSRHNPPLSGE